MKDKFAIFLLIFIIGVGCKGMKTSNEQYHSDKYIILDDNFVQNVKSTLGVSKKNALKIEREAFLARRVDNKQYLDNLNESINDIEVYNDETFFDNFLKNVVLKHKNEKVESIHFINVTYGDDEFNKIRIALIKKIDGNVVLYSSNDNKKEHLNDDLVEFTNQLMLNLPYSFENKNQSLNGYFTIDRIVATGQNSYDTTSTVILQMLYYQLEIIRKMYDVK